MLEHFTESARSSVVLAECEARELGSDDIGPEHLLLALTATGESAAGRALAEAGVTEAALRAALVSRRRSGPFDEQDVEALRSVGIDLEAVLARLGAVVEGGAVPRSNSRRGRLRFTRGARKSLQLAVREAIRLKSAEIGGEHLLLGLLRSDDPALTSVVAGLDVDVGALRKSLLHQLGSTT